jgi:hypothetical protein
MSNADDNQGRRGLFRRNRPTEPVASAPLSDTETQNAETAVGESLPNADRKQARRPGLGRRKPAADGSWSSDAWEDGWDDDWSDRSSRAGVRPAADPRPAEVDAWLASSDDQLGDITRDIARKWTGNKQTETANAAITWADDVPAPPSRALVNEPFVGDPFADEPGSGRFAEPADSLTSDDDLWDTPAVGSGWSSAPNDASDLIDFAEDALPAVQPSIAPINLGSTWDDVEPVVPAVEPVDPELKVEPTDFDEPVTATPNLAEPLSDSLILTGPISASLRVPSGESLFQPASRIGDSELNPKSSPEIASSLLEPEAPQPPSFFATEPVDTAPENASSAPTDADSSDSVPSDSVPSDSVRVDSVATNTAQVDPESLDPGPFDSDSMQSETPATPSELAFDFAGSMESTGLPVEEAASLEEFVQVTQAEPTSHLDTAEIPETVESIATPIESVVAPIPAPEPLIQAAPEHVAEPVTAAAAETVQEVATTSSEASETTPTEITPTQPVERDEFLDSLYEELDDEDVPAERKVVHPEPRTQIVSPIAEAVPFVPNQAITNDAVESVQIVETVAVAPLVDLPSTDQVLLNVAPTVTDDVDFAPSNTDFDRRVTEPLGIPSAEATVGSGPSPLVPQDPNADFDFGPDRPVYAPKVSPSIAPASIAAPAVATTAATAATSQNAAVPQDDDDLFPATKADRFGAALDQLDDDQTDPSGLQEPEKKGFLRGRKNRKALEAEPLSAALASNAAASESTISPDKLIEGIAGTAGTAGTAAAGTATAETNSAISALRDERAKPADQSVDAPENEDDLADLDEYDDDDLDDYPEEAYFSPKLTKLLARAGFLLVALAAIRMLVLVGLAVRDGATDGQGIQDVFHRIGSAFAELGLAHGLMLIVGIAMAAAPALLGDPYIDDESRSIGATFGIGLIAAIFGVFGGFAAARLAMRVNDIAEIVNPGVSSTTKWAKLAMNLVATAGLSLIAVVAAVRALGGDRPDQD